MGFSFSEDTGNGSKTTFAFSFVGLDDGYFNADDIVVYVNGVAVVHSLTGPNQVTLVEAPEDGAKVRIIRKPDLSAPYTDFMRGNAFGKTNVNRSFLQQLYVAHRIMDGFKEEGYYEKQNLSMGTIYKITDLADGVNPKDAATVSQVGSNNADTAAYKDAAAASAVSASSSAATALLYKNQASMSVIESAASANEAEISADEAAASAASALVSKDSANVSASNAANSASVATNQATTATTAASVASSAAATIGTSVTDAAASAASALNSKNTATTAASNAQSSASSASTYASQAAASAGTIGTAVEDAEASATTAAASAASALTSKNAAATSASSATTSASTATTKAALAESWSNTASGFADSALLSKDAAAGSASNAATYSSNAEGYKNSAATSASTATTKASEASSSAASALASAALASESVHSYTEYGSLSAMVTAIGSNKATVIIDSTPPNLTAALTIPTNIHLIWYAGAILSGSFTLTIQGPISAGPYQIFSSPIVLGKASCNEVYVEWFGAKADDSTNCYTAFQAAINSVTSTGYTVSTIKLLGGVYRIGTTLTISKGCTIEGQGSSNIEGSGTVIKATANTTLFNINGSSIGSGTVENVYISKVYITTTATATSGSHGIKMTGTALQIMVHVTDVCINKFYDGINITGPRLFGDKLSIHNQVNKGVYFVSGDMCTLRDTRVVATGSDAIDFQGLYGRLIDCETFGANGWGVRAKDIEIIGGYFNNDRQGEILIQHTSAYLRGGSISGCVIEWAGVDPGGWWTTNNTAPGIMIHLFSASETINISNVYLSESKGIGLLVESGTVNCTGSTIIESGKGSSNRNVHVTGGSLSLSACHIKGGAGGDVFIGLGELIITGCHFTATNQSLKVVHNLGGNLILCNNFFTLNPALSYYTPIVALETGISTAMGNQVTAKSTGAGTFIAVYADASHRVVYNAPRGWVNEFPTPVYGLYTPN